MDNLEDYEIYTLKRCQAFYGGTYPDWEAEDSIERKEARKMFKVLFMKIAERYFDENVTFELKPPVSEDPISPGFYNLELPFIRRKEESRVVYFPK